VRGDQGRGLQAEGDRGAAAPRLWPVVLAGAYDAVGHAVVAPVLPALGRKAGASPLATSAIFAGSSVGMCAGFALAALMVRRWGPRRTLLAGVMAHVAADVAFAAGSSAAAYTAARVVQGLGSGAMWMGSVLAVLTWWDRTPGKALGAVLTAYAAGSVLGPLLAGLGGTTLPFLADAALGVLVAVAVGRLPVRRAQAFGWRSGVLTDRRFGFASAVLFFTAATYASVEGSYTLLFAERASQAVIAVLVTTLAAASGLGAVLPVVTRDPHQGRVGAQLGVVAAACLLIGVSAVHSVGPWFALLALTGAVLGATETGGLGLLATLPEEGMLTATVANAQAWALGFLVGPPLATWLRTAHGPVAPALALLGLAVVVALTGVGVRASTAAGPPAPTGGRG
jgi:Major Facilitator Superfamily